MTRNLLGSFALAFTLATGMATAGALYAQEPNEMGGMMNMMNMMENCPMMGAMREGPQAVLGQREELGLTPTQVQRLEELQKRAEQAGEPMMERLRAARQEIRRVTEGERLDEAAARAAFDRMGDLHTDMVIGMLRTRDEVRQLLTPEQRDQLQAMGRGMMEMGGEMNMMRMMMEMMRNCPMMQGGMG